MFDRADFDSYIREKVELFSKPPTIPDYLYHYTPAFYEIVTNNNLRATHFGHLNDGSEMSYGHEVFIGAFDRLIEEEKRSPLSFQFKTIRHNLSTRRITNSPFVFSMCERGNELSQWREYGKETTAYSIGFHGHAFQPGNLNVPFELVKMEYNDETQKAYAFDLVRASHDYAVAMKLSLPEEPNKSEFFITVSEYAYALQSRFKHPAFRSEREWRIIVASSAAGDNVCFRQSRMGVTPYVSLSVKEGGRLPIARVNISPSPHSETAHTATCDFLDRKGYKNVPVEGSRIPVV